MNFSPESLTVAVTKKGFRTVFDGNRSLLSRYRPDEEARRRMSAAGIKPGQPLLILGDPLGYHAAAAFDGGCTPLMVIYPGRRFRNASVFSGRQDSGGDSRIVTEETDFEAEDAAAKIENFFKCGTATLWVIPTLEPYFRESFLFFEKLIRKCLREKAVNESVRLAFSRSWLSNALRRFSTPANTGHFNLNPKTPVLIAAPGPSLEKTIPDIIKYRNRFLLTAVTSAGRILRDNGITPDFYIATDPGFYAKRLTFFLPPPRCGWLLPPTAAAVISADTPVHPFRQQMAQEEPGGVDFLSNTVPVLNETPTVTAAARLFFFPFEKSAFAGLDLGNPSGKPYARGHQTFFDSNCRADRMKPAESFFNNATGARHSNLFLEWFAETAVATGKKPVRINAPTPCPDLFTETGSEWFASLPEQADRPVFVPEPEKAKRIQKKCAAFLIDAVRKIDAAATPKEILSLPEAILSAAVPEALRIDHGSAAPESFKMKALRRFRRWSTRVR